MHPERNAAETERTLVLEAFADTIIPGEKRFPGDRSVAGAAPGGGAVAAGAVELIEHPAGGLAPALESMVVALNEHAAGYAAEHGVRLADDVPPFVALPFAHRAALVDLLTRPGHPEKDMWVGLALFSNMAYDSAAHLDTIDALAAGHPGLLAIGYAQPDSDQLWRFAPYSYGRQLAEPHPDTTSTGSPA
ncbi:hypothetical protein GA0070616_4954 [Micromonospora nigra]|uniref:Gluconate 2-dehydrogenase subunit 3 n=1 Tax=Micromonospora nigra TaxID=145857 RepID=A0A1C6SY07_9ACTN|nr:DUF5987 family protein [Micromonospora nigra]SCL34378.1 hypothetical protein GA0070616_4954 [Micromonospora nigra]